MNETQKDLLKTATEIILVILSAVLPAVATKLKNKILKKRKDEFVKTHNTPWSKEVFEDVVELRLNTHADRAWVLLRSNGTSYYNGLKGDHLTMLYESLESGVSGILPRTQKIPIHFFEDSVSIADKDGFVKVVTDKLIESSFFRADLEDKGTILFFGVPMRKCEDSIPEGYVGVSFLIEPDLTDEYVISTLKHSAAIIGSALRVNK